MVRVLYFFATLLFCSCKSYQKLSVQASLSFPTTGTAFYRTAAAFNWKQRDTLAVKEILSGNIPSFLKTLVPINISIIDSSTGKAVLTFISELNELAGKKGIDLYPTFAKMCELANDTTNVFPVFWA